VQLQRLGHGRRHEMQKQGCVGVCGCV
jgi:hypothetical protein